MKKIIEERFLLAQNRIREIETEESLLPESFTAYFRTVASFFVMLFEQYEFVESGRIYSCPMEELQEKNQKLYEDILPETYEKSYGNPTYCEAVLGESYGALLCFLYAEIRSLIPCVYEQRMEDMTAGMELFLEMYGSFLSSKEEGTLPEEKHLREILYFYVYDYTREAFRQKIRVMLDVKEDFAWKIMEKADLSTERYLYYFGEYVSYNERETCRHFAELSDETVQKMADTYTEGYRIGFLTGNKDLSKKRTVNIRYCLGFERMIRKAVENFRRMGLEPTIYRAEMSTLKGRGINRNGYYGGIPNKQYDFDHKDDQALILDKRLLQVRLEALKDAYEQYKEKASVFGGPAVVETFGEKSTASVIKKEALHLSEQQQQMLVEYAAAAGEIQNRYIKEEERSFTIIAYPVPEIGEAYPAIFDEVIRINTLDYKKYQTMQQKIIDVLDRGKYVLVKGTEGNRTNMKVVLHPLNDPYKQTNFENCVADVNIPVGEVFTSPVLEGTEGVLHVSHVYLGELEYKNMMLTFENGMVTEYSCENFADSMDNQKYIKENVLYHHETLPIGEFAIGTNTVAFAMAKKYQIEDKLPILIAEKTGPHFAVGDTCYSHCEEVVVHNPDGKEIIAKDNECSIKRLEDSTKAYFNCHTDITLPYDELGEISVVTKEEEVIPILIEGRFVLEGCEELNEPFGLQ